jgi:hypothetical protein
MAFVMLRTVTQASQPFQPRAVEPTATGYLIFQQ